MKINCKEMEELLISYIDNEINSNDSAMLKEHLRNCSLCSEELKAMEEIRELLKSRKAVEPPPFLESRIISAVKDIKASQGLKWQVFPGEWKLIPLLSTVLIALVFIWGSYTDKPGGATPVDEYIYGAMTAENNTILLDESPISQDDMLEAFLNL